MTIKIRIVFFKEHRRLISTFNGDEREHSVLKSKKQDLVLSVEGGEKKKCALRICNQDSQVEENVIKLKVAHFEKAVRRVGTQIYSIEKQR